MNSVVALVLVFALSFASAAPATTVAAYAGTTDGTNLWTPPVTSPACTAGATADVKYETFPLDIASTGVYQLRCIYEQQWRTTGRALIYSGTFSADASCTGFVYEAKDSLGLSGGPRKNDGVYLNPGTYTVVVTGASPTDTGLFACNVKQSSVNGNTTSSSLIVNAVTNSQSGSCSSSFETVGASVFSWTQDNSGLYDINVYFSNTTYDVTANGAFGATAALYAGNVIAWFNETENDPCDTRFDAAWIVGGQLNGQFATILQNISLTAGNNYTLLVSGENPESLGYYGVSVDPTIVQTNANSPGTWTQPSRSTDPEDECEPSSSTNQYFYAYTFVAEYPTYIFDTQVVDWTSSPDTYSFLYSGINNATVPETCGGANGISLLYSGDTGDVRPLAFLGLSVGQYYTVIVSNYGGASRGAFAVYAMTGSQIGVVPTGTATSTTGGEPSASSSVAVSFLLLIIAAFFTTF